MAIWNKNTQLYLPGNKSLFEAFVLADKNGNVINSFGNASNIPLAAGVIDGYKHINKFGFNPALSGNSDNIETIWDRGGEYSYVTTGNAGVVTVARGGGSQTGSIRVEGLDANYVEITEDINFSGTSTNGTQNFYRINRAYLLTLNTGSANTHNITMTIDGSVRAQITAKKGQTLQAVYTVPAGKTAYLTKVQFVMEEKEKTGFYDLRFKNGTTNDIWRTLGHWGLGQGTTVTYDYAIPLKIAEKSDIEAVCAADSGEGASAIFDIILVDN